MSQEKKVLLIALGCIIVIAWGFWRLKDQKTPTVINQERLGALKVSIENWAQANQGKAPESLDVLGLPDDAIKDFGGEPFQYTVSEAGEVQLISYGIDGKPGGHTFQADTEIRFTLPEATGN